MKTFKKLLSEVAEPQAGDEINFKKKHIIQRFYDPAGNDDAFTGNVSTEWDMVNGKRFYNHADYKDGEDEDVYESVDTDISENNYDDAFGYARGYHGSIVRIDDERDAHGFKKGDHVRVGGLISHRSTWHSGTNIKTGAKGRLDPASHDLIKESEQLDEISDKKLRTYMKAASDIAAKSDDAKTVAKRSDGVLKASEKIKEAHSHPLYDMHGLEDEDINNDGVVDEKDAAMKRARELLQKKRYYLEDVADDTTHIKNHGTKKKYAKTNAVLAPTHKVKSIVEEEQLDEISINLKQKYYDKSNDAKRAAGYGYSHKNDDGTLKSDQEGKRAFTRMKSMNKVQDELKWHKNPVQANVHDLTHMKHDGDVYDHTQTSEKMKDGDVMKLHGGRAAVLVGAWPVITHGDSDILHKVKEGSHITKLDKGRYKKSFEVASKHATAPELKESEDLQELSKDTLKSYRSGALSRNKSDFDDLGAERERSMSTYGHNHSSHAYDLDKQIKKRGKFINLAQKKIAEESEQLDELSKKTLSSYVKKAADSYAGAAMNMRDEPLGSTERDKAIKEFIKRNRGISKASDKLAEDGAAYAIGMSKAKEIHNDEPPLRKKTIKTAHKIAKAIIGESDENCNCYHIAGSEDSHHIENLKSLAPNSRIADGIAKVSREDEEAIAYMDKHFPSLHEDVDQLDEISNETKAKYLDKAVQQRYDFFTKGRNDPSPLKRRKPMSYYEKPEVKKALAKDAKRGEIIDKTAKELTGNPHYSKMSTSTSSAVHGNADAWWKGKKYATEDVDQLDELSKDTLGKYAKKALNYGDNAARMSHSDDDEMGKIASKRFTGVKKAVDKMAGNRKADATRIKGNVDKARESARNRYTDKSDQGKAYYAAQKGIAKIREDADQLDELSKSTLKSYANRAMNDVRNSNQASVRWAHSRGANSVYDGTPGETEKKQARIAKNRERGVRRVIDKLTKESLDEAFSVGSLKLDDGSYVTVNKQDAALLNQMFKDLNTANKKKMEKVLMTDKHGFQEILGFAREAL